MELSEITTVEEVMVSSIAAGAVLVGAKVWKGVGEVNGKLEMLSSQNSQRYGDCGVSLECKASDSRLP